MDEIHYQSADGLALYARDYPSERTDLTLLCMPGLTRNAADFEDFCAALQPHYRCIAVDQRGRGRSQYDSNPANYQPATYVQDMFTLIDELGLENVVLVGTSLGGLMAMMMNAMRPGQFAGVVLNDIGPEVNQAGLDRIKNYVGKAAPVNSWEEAIAQTKATNGLAFPKVDDTGWAKFARRIYGENAQGIPELLYDPAISTPMEEADNNAVPPDLWPVFDALAGVPSIVIRGELSDILHPDSLAEMRRRKPDIEVIEIPDVGHAPMLDEPGVVTAISAFLSSLTS